MFHNYSQEELRSYCRNCIESLELWARRLIHEKMTNAYGVQFVDALTPSGEPLIKGEIRKHIHQMKKAEPDRFSRDVDTLFVDNIIYFLCNPKWYNSLFKEALDYIYPQGKDEAREFLNRLVPIRNALSHANPISIHQAEQATCYTHDFIEGLKQYYIDKGAEKVWNIPQIIRATDSKGNVYNYTNGDNEPALIFWVNQEFYVGEEYGISVEPDPSFPEESYTIRWEFSSKELKRFRNKKQITLKFENSDVSESNHIVCLVISNKEWHKYKFYDQRTIWSIKIYPSIDE